LAAEPVRPLPLTEVSETPAGSTAGLNFGVFAGFLPVGTVGLASACGCVNW